MIKLINTHVGTSVMLTLVRHQICKSLLRVCQTEMSKSQLLF